MRLLKHFLIFLALFVQTVSAQSVANPKVTYFHNGITGTAVAATDEKGEVIWREQRRAYGEIKVDPLKPRSLDEFSVGYTGHQADKESGLTYAKARYYNKVIGRFYAPDPIPFREDDLVSINRYAYAGNNPYKYVDPTGKTLNSVLDLIIEKRDLIQAAAKENNVSPQLIASIIFQEKLWTTSAKIKNIPAHAKLLVGKDASIGLAEMTVSTAADILGINPEEKREEIINMLNSEKQAIDLIAKNIKRMQKSMKEKNLPLKTLLMVTMQG